MAADTSTPFSARTARCFTSDPPNVTCTRAPLDGVRVLVLHPPNGIYGWNNARAYVGMVPTLTLDREIEPSEAANWFSRIAPGRETDLMGRNRG